MKQVGELVVAKNRLGVMATLRRSGAGGADRPDLTAGVGDAGRGHRVADDAGGRGVRAVPRLVRDLSRDLGKRIRFDLEGEEIELDRSILDEIGDPLLHLIRNAADHGIESPEARAAAGKPPEGVSC